MPRGYDTAGPDAALSGGRTAATHHPRAILADARSWCSTEATASPTESEYLVQQSLPPRGRPNGTGHRAHRLHTVTGVDAIVVVDGGQIVETGTHAELLAAGGRYRAGIPRTGTDEPVQTAGAHRMITTVLRLSAGSRGDVALFTVLPYCP